MKYSVILLLSVLSLTFLNFNNKEKSGKKLQFTDDVSIVVNNNKPLAGYVYSLIPPPSDTIPGFSGFVDYASNGNALKQLIQTHDTLIVSATYVDSAGASDPNNNPSLRVICNYSFNNGQTWEYLNRVPVTISKSRFGDNCFVMSGFITSGFSGRNWNSPPTSSVRRAGASYDVIIGAGSYTTNFFGGTLGYDVYSDTRFDGKMACIVKTPSFTAGGIDTLYYTTYNPMSPPYFSALKPVAVTSLDNSSASYTLAASPVNANHITAVYCYINTLNLNLVPVTTVKTSTNGGDNWSSPVEINPAGLINGDSAACFWHEDIAYKPGTNNVFVVFSTDNAGTGSGPDEIRKSYKICIWNQSLNGGLPVVIADWHNISILGSSTEFAKIRNMHINCRVLNHPSLGFSSNGGRMFVAYSVMQADTNTYGFNYEDVYYQYSDNGGLNWTNPVNMTGSPGAVEKYTVVPKVFYGSLPPVMYQWDLVPGCQSFTDLAPVNRVYWVLKKDILTSTPNSELNNSPKNFSLHQNYPNPFNPSTKIKFQIPLLKGVSGEAGQLVTPGREGVFTSLRVFDILGREVHTLVNENLKPGIYEADFNAADLPSGIYFYSLAAGDFAETKKMILIK